jgi:hypothetical protein
MFSLQFLGNSLVRGLQITKATTPNSKCPNTLQPNSKVIHNNSKYFKASSLPELMN